MLSAPPLHRKWWRGQTTVSTHTGRWYPPSRRHPGPLVAWCPPPSIRPAGAVHKSMTFRCVFMLVQLNKCVVVDGSDLQREHSDDGCLSSSILFKYECCIRHIGDHMVETYSSLCLVMALYVARIVSFCFPHVVDVGALSICIVLRYFVVVISMCLLYVSLGSRVSPSILG